MTCETEYTYSDEMSLGSKMLALCRYPWDRVWVVKEDAAVPRQPPLPAQTQVRGSHAMCRSQINSIGLCYPLRAVPYLSVLLVRLCLPTDVLCLHVDDHPSHAGCAGTYD